MIIIVKKINIPATLIFDGETYEEVGVRFKGQTSYFNTNGTNGGGPGNGPGGSNVDTDKKSFNIEIDWVHDQDIDGYETLNLNNCYQDPSFLREFLFEKLSRKYLPSVQVNYVNLFINDQDWGIYPNVQQLDKNMPINGFLTMNVQDGGQKIQIQLLQDVVVTLVVQVVVQVAVQVAVQILVLETPR